jgi:ketosteroid isomerase-like protein
MPGLPPPTGKEYTTDMLMLFKLRDGKITEGWMYGTISGMV